MGHPFAFTADANTLLPLVSFIKDLSFEKTEKKLFVNPINIGLDGGMGFEPTTFWIKKPDALPDRATPHH
jgi:hypothetical protein